MTLVAPLVISLSLFGVGSDQTRPDFSGKWARIPNTPDEFAETIVVTHTGDTLTISDPKSGAIVRQIKLDGSENRNVQGKPPNEVVEVFRAAWDGSSLVFRGSGSSADGTYLLRAEFSLDGDRLLVHVTQTSPTTGALLREQKLVYSK